MNFYINSITNNTFSFVSEKILVSLSVQQKKIFAIAAVALACLVAAFYLLRHLCLTDEHIVKPLPPFTIEEKDLPKSYQEYIALGKRLPIDGIVQFNDGTHITQMTQQGLFLKAIEINPKDPLAYDLLGTTLVNNDIITLLDRSKFTQQELFLQAIDLDPCYAPAYNNLGATLKGGSMVLPDGSQMTAEQQLVKAIKHNINVHRKKADEIELKDGTKITETDLFRKTIELDPNYATAYFNYYVAVDRTIGRMAFIESLELPDGTQMAPWELLYKTVELNPLFAEAYCKLAKFIKKVDGKPIADPADHYVEAIKCDPKYAFAYYLLAEEIFIMSGQPCKFADGRVLSAEELIREAIKLNPYTDAYGELLKRIIDKK